jgi:hypothetical protein
MGRRVASLCSRKALAKAEVVVCFLAAIQAVKLRKFGVAALEFDGRTDSLFHPFDGEGRKFMEYIQYRGVYEDLPHEEMFRSLREIYPHLF